MSKQNINTRNIVLVLMILAAIAFRFLSFEYKALSNFTPVGAIAIFGGAYFADKWKAISALTIYTLQNGCFGMAVRLGCI